MFNKQRKVNPIGYLDEANYLVEARRRQNRTVKYVPRSDKMTITEGFSGEMETPGTRDLPQFFLGSVQNYGHIIQQMAQYDIKNNSIKELDKEEIQNKKTEKFLASIFLKNKK